MKFVFLIFITCVSFVLSSDRRICRRVTWKVADKTNCRKYFICVDGVWKQESCLLHQVFDDDRKACVRGLLCRTRTKRSAQQYPSPYYGGSYNSPFDFSRRFRTGSHYVNDDESQSETVYRKFRSKTISVNGDSKTTLWYYNSQGPNYKFTIYGGLPASKSEMIEWLETNHHRYKITPVPYLGDADEDEPQHQSRPEYPRYPKTTTTTSTTTTTTTTERPRRLDSPSRYDVRPMTWKQILPSECGYSAAEVNAALGDRIVNGTPTTIESNPWQVALVDGNSKMLYCGGSIISKKHVLTATHCFIRSQVTVDDQGKRRKEEKIASKSSLLVYAGDSNLNDPKMQYKILDLYLHSKYKMSHRRNDIALILIDGDFAWSVKVYPVCLPQQQATYQADRYCRISGWGKTASENSNTEDVLHDAEVKIVKSDDCKRENQKFLEVSRGMFCAGDYENGQVDTCQGDSGGPCVCSEEGRSTLFGITSWGIGCGRAKYPGVYVKVAEYRNWIHDRLEVSLGSKSRDSLTYDDDVGGDEEEKKEETQKTEDWDEDIH